MEDGGHHHSPNSAYTASPIDVYYCEVVLYQVQSLQHIAEWLAG